VDISDKDRVRKVLDPEYNVIKEFLNLIWNIISLLQNLRGISGAAQSR
jgi:hypothetical protein